MKKQILKAAFFGDTDSALEIRFLERSEREGMLARMFTAERRARIAEHCKIHPRVITRDNFARHLPDLETVDVVFSTWGMLPLTAEEIARMPNLKIIFYAAGSVQGFAAPYLAAGVRIVSAAAANAVPVAEFTLAQILLANKGYFRNLREYDRPETIHTAFRGDGNYNQTVALLGLGTIGRLTVERLKPFQIRILAFDPFLSDECAAELGVEKVELAEAFRRGMVVSNHLANKPATRGMLRKEHFEAMPPGAVFINTGRGATVDEPAMLDVMQARPDLTALLDVTDPEPPEKDSPLFSLPNVLVSSHIAGSINGEVQRLADHVIDEFLRWHAGQPLLSEVTADRLNTMA